MRIVGWEEATDASQIPPIYTLSIYNAIANGGRYVRPRLVKGLRTESFDSVMPVSYIRDRICSEENARKMQDKALRVLVIATGDDACHADVARLTPGYNVRTTIDIQLQDIVENELNRVLDSCSADWGCAVLMDVKTGDIKAISNLERSKNGNGYIEALNYAVVGF